MPANTAAGEHLGLHGQLGGFDPMTEPTRRAEQMAKHLAVASGAQRHSAAATAAGQDHLHEHARLSGRTTTWES